MTAPNVGAEVRRRLKAAPERVFAAFADQELVAQWLRPSPDVRLTVLEFDLRIGGAYRFAYDARDGRRMLVGGTFRTIEALERGARPARSPATSGNRGWRWTRSWPPACERPWPTPAVREVKMFGGLGFMPNGNMIAACSERGLLVRVGALGESEALERGAQPMIESAFTVVQWALVGPLMALALSRVHAGVRPGRGAEA